MHLWRRNFAVGLTWLWFAGASAVLAVTPTGLWAPVDSDQAPAPELISGQLSNGLRYFILPNTEPKGHLSLRLLVAAGSLLEGDDERGLAHFVEHMAFRGTTSHPSGSLVPALQRLGVSFGPDSAAFTSYDHTIYHLDLPQADEATVRQGLQIFHEFATEVTFDPALIEVERGVVMSEAKYRDTPDSRQYLADLGFLWPKARLVERAPIGLAEQIDHFSRDRFQAFYDAWYRPERMVVIAVGDAEPSMIRRLIEAQLGDLAPRGPARSEPPNLAPSATRSPDVTVFLDPGLLGCVFVFQHAEKKMVTRDTHEQRVHALELALANTMLQRRLYRRSLDPKTPFASPSVGAAEDVPGWRVATMSVSGRGDDWDRVAAELEREHRRAYLYGFTASELEAAKAAVTARYEEAVRTAASWGSVWLANTLAEDIRRGTVFIRPVQAREDLEPEIAAITPDRCANAFRAAWTSRAPLVLVAANVAFRVSPMKIGAALNRSRAEAVRPYSERKARDFEYTNFGAPGKIAQDEVLSDLNVHLVRFENGVACNFKPTDFEKDIVQVRVRVGDGKLSQPRDLPGLDFLANEMTISGGLKRHAIDAIADMVAARSFVPEFHVESDACVFSARCSKRDLAFALQMLTAYIADPAFRDDALRAAQARFGSMYESLATSPGGPVSLLAGRALADGDKRFGTPTPTELERRTMREVKSWLSPQFRHGGIEASVVGDVTWDEAAPLIGRTLGALPRRAARTLRTADTALRPPRPPVAPTVLPAPALTRQGALAWYWPVPSVSDVTQERRLYLLASIFEERMRVRLRDELGATYASDAQFEQTRGFPAMNWLSYYAEVNPTQLEKAFQLVERESMAFALSGPPKEEFERGLRVYVRQMTDDVRTNEYWGTTVLCEAQENPLRIAAARNRAADLGTITWDQVRPLAASLDPANSFRFVVTPNGTNPTPAGVVKSPAARVLFGN